LVLGRGFGPQDTDKSWYVAVINETMARLFFLNGSSASALGLTIPNPAKFPVIGVVKMPNQQLTERRVRGFTQCARQRLPR
jgi:hypothetical protein